MNLNLNSNLTASASFWHLFAAKFNPMECDWIRWVSSEDTKEMQVLKLLQMQCNAIA